MCYQTVVQMTAVYCDTLDDNDSPSSINHLEDGFTVQTMVIHRNLFVNLDDSGSPLSICYFLSP